MKSALFARGSLSVALLIMLGCLPVVAKPAAANPFDTELSIDLETPLLAQAMPIGPQSPFARKLDSSGILKKFVYGKNAQELEHRVGAIVCLIDVHPAIFAEPKQLKQAIQRNRQKIANYTRLHPEFLSVGPMDLTPCFGTEIQAKYLVKLVNDPAVCSVGENVVLHST